MKRIFALFLALLLLLPSLSSCGARTETRAFYGYFDTDVLITLSAPAHQLPLLFEGAQDLLAEAEALFSRTSPTAELARVNAAKEERVTLSPALAALLARALAHAEATDGLFDPTAGALTDLFDIGGNSPYPSAESVVAAREKTGYTRLSLEGTLLTRPSETVLDLGAIAKGYIAEMLVAYFEEAGVGFGVLSLGGNIAVFGEKPNGAAFSVGVRSPFAENGTLLGTMRLYGTLYVSTSGAYERYRTDENGRIYHHIFDMRTGYPAESDLASVTVISRDGAQADALSTALYAMGREAALAYLATCPDIAYILVTNDKQTITSPNLEYTPSA